jgi:glycosyltransferase involved in cell wall biosynthesis
MRVVIDIDGRYDRTPDGAVWAKSGCLYDYWIRFLEVFDSVRLVARVREVACVPPEMRRVDGENIEFAAIPHYAGLLEYAAKLPWVRRAARSAFEWGDAIVLCGGPVSGIMYARLRKEGYPYAVRVVGDPHDVFAPGAVVHPLRPLFQWWAPRLLRRLCSQAGAATYVTEHKLQAGYPCPGYSAGVSDVDLPPTAFADGPRAPRPGLRKICAVTVGSLAQLYKAPDVLIDATAECVRGGLDLELVLCGGGRHLSELRLRASARGLNGRVQFRGQLPREAVFEELDRADLFVLPSRQEGLPRAMVEAMARALPCIGSDVGGIPELLPPEDLVRPDDPHALAAKIREIASSPERMAAMSIRNLRRAADFRADVLHDKWLEFYRYVRDRTEEWLKANGQSGSFT